MFLRRFLKLPFIMASHSIETGKTVKRTETIPIVAGDPRPSTNSQSAIRSGSAMELADRDDGMSRGGILIVNADDWGRNQETTNRIFDCTARGTVSSVSAMVFMEDSERAAKIAREQGVDAGLHLNFTTPFSTSGAPSRLTEHQRRLASYLRRHRLTQVVFHPGLTSSFEYVVLAQLDEFRRLYGTSADRIDGHHHMHLCANVIFRNLLPSGTIVRRNFSFQLGEKKFVNRLYRQGIDRLLARRHRLTDYFFSLPPMEPIERLQRICSLSREFVVELETHPVNPDEYQFLTNGAILHFAVDGFDCAAFCGASTRIEPRRMFLSVNTQ